MSTHHNNGAKESTSAQTGTKRKKKTASPPAEHVNGARPITVTTTREILIDAVGLLAAHSGYMLAENGDPDNEACVHEAMSVDLIPLTVEGHGDRSDALAQEWALEQEIPIKMFLTDWERYGKAAGPILNQQMLVEGKPDLVVASQGGRGTANIVSRAQQAGVPVVEIA